MKIKSASSASFAILMFASLLSASFLEGANAQFDGLPYEPPVVTVLSPAANETVIASDVPLNVTVQLFGFIYHNIEHINSLNYSFNGDPAVAMDLVVPSDLQPGYTVRGNSVLTDLPDGNHTLTIYGEPAIGELSGCFNYTIMFSVESSAAALEPFTFLPIVGLVAVAVVGTVVWAVFYCRKRRLN